MGGKCSVHKIAKHQYKNDIGRHKCKWERSTKKAKVSAHPLKAYRGSSGIALLILSLDGRCS
jgi:hypothetical protein